MLWNGVVFTFLGVTLSWTAKVAEVYTGYITLRHEGNPSFAPAGPVENPAVAPTATLDTQPCFAGPLVLEPTMKTLPFVSRAGSGGEKTHVGSYHKRAATPSNVEVYSRLEDETPVVEDAQIEMFIATPEDRNEVPMLDRRFCEDAAESSQPYYSIVANGRVPVPRAAITPIFHPARAACGGEARIDRQN